MTVTQDLSVEVVAMDGHAGSGKGTAAGRVAKRLGFHRLDSGVLYRAVGLICHLRNLTTVPEIVEVTRCLDITIEDETIFLEGKDQTQRIRSDEVAELAKNVASIAQMREALHTFQFSMRKPPGLVADGRDMGRLFNTPHRFFITCDPEIRATRRMEELKRRGLEADYQKVLAEILQRDQDDENRRVSPLKKHPEAVLIDTSELTIAQVEEIILAHYWERRRQR